LPWVKPTLEAPVDAARRSIRTAQPLEKIQTFMNPMKQLDALDLDGRLLQTLVAVVDEGSVTRAAERLELTQSAVSHQLERLRAIVGDALFVKSGRGIVPTVHARELATRARLLLEDMRRFAQAVHFDPAGLQLTLTIGANDLQRDLLLPAFLRGIRAQAPGVRLRVVPSGAPRAEMLRDGPCHLVITPRPPDATDLMHVRLLEDRYAVFYDGTVRAAPPRLDEYLVAEHVTVVHEPHRPLEIDNLLAERGIARRIVAEVPGFGGIGPFLRGTAYLATLPSLLSTHLLRGLAMAEPPLACPVMPMYMVWHLRHQDDPMHQWLRALLQAAVEPALGAAQQGRG